VRQLVAERFARLRICKIPALLAPSHNGAHTRPISCRATLRAEPSRAFREILAGDDVRRRLRQLFGTSTSSGGRSSRLLVSNQRCRFSHSTVSKGDFFPSVKYRSKLRPSLAPPADLLCSRIRGNGFPPNACFTVAIRPSALSGPTRGGTLLFYPLQPAEALRFRSGLKYRNFDSIGSWKRAAKKKAGAERSHLSSSAKTPMPRRGPVLRTQPNSKCSASNTGAEQVLRVRFFSRRTRPFRGSHGP